MNAQSKLPNSGLHHHIILLRAFKKFLLPLYLRSLQTRCRRMGSKYGTLRYQRTFPYQHSKKLIWTRSRTTKPYLRMTAQTMDLRLEMRARLQLQASYCQAQTDTSVHSTWRKRSISSKSFAYQASRTPNRTGKDCRMYRRKDTCRDPSQFDRNQRVYECGSSHQALEMTMRGL